MLTDHSTSRAVLRRHDGADTLYLDDHDGHLTLGWMLVGHAEPFAVVLEAPVDWADARRLAAAPLTNPADILAPHAGSQARMELRTPQGGSVLEGPLPGRVTVSWALKVVLHVLGLGDSGDRRSDPTAREERPSPEGHASPDGDAAPDDAGGTAAEPRWARGAGSAPSVPEADVRELETYLAGV